MCFLKKRKPKVEVFEKMRGFDYVYQPVEREKRNILQKIKRFLGVNK